MDQPGYVPPPAFAPPAQRVAPLNETAVLGHTSYPTGPFAAYPQPAPEPTQAWQPAHLDTRARRRRSLTILVALGVVATLVTISTVLLTSGNSRVVHSLRLPQSFDEFSKVRELNGTQMQSLFQAGGTLGAQIPADDFAGAFVGVYAAAGEVHPTLLFIGFTAEDSPSIGSQLQAGPADSVATRVLAGAGATTPQFVDAGPLGGAMRCARVDVDGTAGAVGVWADRDTLGIVLLLEPVMPSTARTSAVTRDLRAAAER